jgi:hypothetical protein
MDCAASMQCTTRTRCVILQQPACNSAPQRAAPKQLHPTNKIITGHRQHQHLAGSTLLLIPACPAAASVLLLLLASHDRLQRLVVTRHFTAQLLVASQQRSDSSLVMRLQLRCLLSNGTRLQTFNQDRQSTTD